MSGIGRRTQDHLSLGVLLTLFLLGGCSSTLAEVPTPDQNILVIEGYGTKSMVAQKCLTADTIKQLINSEIPSSVPEQTCYWVALISTDSSEISRAITSFIRAKDEFDDKVSGLVAPKATESTRMTKKSPQETMAIDIASSILEAAVTETTESLVKQSANVPENQKKDVKKHLESKSNGISNGDLKEKIVKVLETL